MLGTLVNMTAIFVGGGLGLVLKSGLSDRFRDSLMQVLALCVLFVGASSTLGGMLSDGAEPILFIISMAIGTGLGELWRIEDRLQGLGDSLQAKLGNKGGNFSQGFVTASLLYCVGAMAILGSLESGIQNIHTTLFTKSVLDGITALFLASALGPGVLLSGVSVLLYQGVITLGASSLQPFMTDAMIREISIVGGIMIFGLGLQMLSIVKLRVGNMLPAILVPVVYFLPPVQAAIAWASSLF